MLRRFETIIVILSLVVLLRLPSLFEPYWYGDEGIYLTIGQAIHQGVKLYSGIHDNKPPLLYLTAALVNGNQFWFRFLTLIWNGITVIVFWKLARRWFGNPKIAIFSTIVFVLLTSLPFIEGNIANAEIYFLGLTSLAFYWLYSGKNSFGAGILLGLGALFKIPAILEVAIWPLFWFFTNHPNWFKKSFWLGLGAILPLSLSIIYYASQGILNNYLIAAGLQNIPYLSSWSSAQGLIGTLSGRAAILGIILIVVLLLKKHLSHNALLIAIFWIVGLFAVLLSGRPYPHYLLQIAVCLSLSLGMLFTGKHSEKLVAVSGIILLVGFKLIFQFNFYPVFSYYTNFATWVTGRQLQTTYFNHFDASVSRTYELAKIIAGGSMPNDKIFIWGDVPMIYALTKRLPVGRFTVRYHIKDFRAEVETIAALNQTPPRYILVFGTSADLPGLDQLLGDKYLQTNSINEAQVYRLRYN